MIILHALALLFILASILGGLVIIYLLLKELKETFKDVWELFKQQV